MAPNVEPIFFRVPISRSTEVSTQTATPDGVGTVTFFLTASDSGALILDIEAIPLGANIDSCLYIFTRANNNANTARELRSVVELPATPARSGSNHPNSVKADLPSIQFPHQGKGLYLEPDSQLGVSLSNSVAAGYRISIQGGHYE